jgi:hypothetical protein
MSALETHPLTQLAHEVLRKESFKIGRIQVDGGAPLTVAEDSYSVAAVVAADEWHSVGPLLGQTATAFANWALQRDAGDKQWDLYLFVLLASPIASDSVLAEVEEFASDTRYLRRLVRHGIPPEEPRVRAALSALLPLDLPVRVSERDPFEALVGALRAQGIGEELARETVGRYVELRGLDR